MAEGTLVAKTGNVTKPPELRFSKAGKPFAKFSIAVNPYVPEGQPKPDAQFYDVTVFGSLAQNVAMTLKKGYRVIVVGIGKVETWTAKDGTERSAKVIIADSVGPDLRFVAAEVFKPEGRPQAAVAQTVPSAYGPDEEPF